MSRNWLPRECPVPRGCCTACRDRHHHAVGIGLFGSCWGCLLSGDALLSCVRAAEPGGLCKWGGQAMASAKQGEPLLGTWGSACCGAATPRSAVLILAASLMLPARTARGRAERQPAGRPARAVPGQPGGTAGLAARAGAGRSLGQSRAPQPCCVCPRLVQTLWPFPLLLGFAVGCGPPPAPSFVQRVLLGSHCTLLKQKDDSALQDWRCRFIVTGNLNSHRYQSRGDVEQLWAWLPGAGWPSLTRGAWQLGDPRARLPAGAGGTERRGLPAPGRQPEALPSAPR